MLKKISSFNKKVNFEKFPDKFGRFGKFGGRFVAETLMPLLLEVEKEYKIAKKSKEFKKNLDYYFKNYVGRPSPLYFASRISERLNNAKIYFKRDELNHTGAHKINNCIGQILLAKRMGKKESLLKQGLDNMDLPQQQFVHYSILSVLFTWVKLISKDKRPMFLK